MSTEAAGSNAQQRREQRQRLLEDDGGRCPAESARGGQQGRDKGATKVARRDAP